MYTTYKCYTYTHAYIRENDSDAVLQLMPMFFSGRRLFTHMSCQDEIRYTPPTQNRILARTHDMHHTRAGVFIFATICE